MVLTLLSAPLCTSKTQVYIKRESFLSAGVFHSPPILLASGIAIRSTKRFLLSIRCPELPQSHRPTWARIVYKCPLTCDTRPAAVAPWKLPGHSTTTFRYEQASCRVSSWKLLATSDWRTLHPSLLRVRSQRTWKEMASGPEAPHIELIFRA
jgi:hypothetical protein